MFNHFGKINASLINIVRSGNEFFDFINFGCFVKVFVFQN